MIKSNRFKANKLALSVAVAALALGAVGGAHAADDKILSLDVVSQNIGSALVELSKNSGVQIVLSQELGDSVKLEAIKGDFTLTEALDRMLDGSGLVYEFRSEDLVVISEDDADSASPNEEYADEEILVTGSRIKRTELEVSTPMTILDGEKLRQRGYTNVADLLKESPLIVGTRTAENTVDNPSNAGVETVSLRGLSSLSGSSRTLSLVDGRRHVASIPGSSDVDVSTIPSALVERVEIITGGSSAVYGSEAIAGVINYVIKDDFEGFDVSSQYGINGRGDGEQKSLSVTWGTNFDGGNLALSITRDENEETLVSKRGFLNNESLSRLTQGGTTISDARSLTTTFGGTPVVRGNALLDDGSITGTPGTPLRFGANGQLVEFTQNPVGIFSSGGDGVPQGVATPSSDILSTPVDRTIANGFFNYDLTDKTAFFFEGKYVDIKAQAINGLPQINVDLNTSNPNLDPATAAFLNANGASNFSFERALPELGPQTGTLDTELFRVVTGLEGVWADEYDWSLSLNYGKSDRDSRNADFDRTRFEASVADGTVDLFGPDANLTAAQLAGSRLNGQVDDEVTQKVAGFSITGPLLELPAGTMDFAAGVEYRKEEVESTPNADARTNGLIFFGRNPVAGSFDVKEVYGEVNVPLLADAPGAELLNLDLSARYGDYSTVDGLFSWKSGLSWVPVEDVRFRVSYGTSVRAPSGAELFRPEETTPILPFSLIDPCSPFIFPFISPEDAANAVANCAVVAPDLQFPAFGPFSPGFVAFAAPDAVNITQNNPNLKEETATTFTAGVVLTPSFAEGLTVTLDYWSMEVDDAIEILDSRDYETFCIRGSASSGACQAVVRDPITNQITAQITQYTNITDIALAGYDFTAGYDFDAGEGVMTLTLNATYLDKFEETSSIDGITEDRVGKFSGGANQFGANASANYTVGSVSAFVNARYQDDRDASDIFGVPAKVNSVVYYDTSVNWNVDETWSVTLGASNLFNTEPKSDLSNFVRTYDLNGRSFFLSFNGRFE